MSYSLVLASVGCARGPEHPLGSPADEAAVHEAVLRYMHDPMPEALVIRDSTAMDHLFDDLAEELRYVRHGIGGELSMATVRDFSRKNEERHPVGPGLHLPTPHTVTTRAELESIFADDDLAGWSRLHERYPGAQGIHTFSRVGFAPQFTEALVYVGHQ